MDVVRCYRRVTIIHCKLLLYGVDACVCKTGHTRPGNLLDGNPQNVTLSHGHVVRANRVRHR